EPPPQLLHTLAAWLKEAGGDPEPTLRAAQRRRPWDFWLNNALAGMLWRDNPGESVGFYRAALVARPRVSMLYTNMADALRRQKRDVEAIAAARRAIELDPKNSAAYNNLGSALQSLGKLGEAIAALRRAIELDPKGFPAHYNLGSTLLSHGESG